MVESSNFISCQDCPIFKYGSNGNGHESIDPNSGEQLSTSCDLGNVYFSRYFDVPNLLSPDFKPILDEIISSLPDRFLRRWLQVRANGHSEIYGIQAKDVQGCGGSMTLASG